MSFRNIKNSSELKDFLVRCASKHKFLFHYTTTEKLQCIFENKTWRLYNAKTMNDLQEYKEKGNSSLWEKLYSTCFSFGDEDNIAMWSMYGIPWEDAVRIRLSTDAIKKWMNTFDGKPYKTSDSSSNYTLNISDSQDSVVLHDICYYQGYFGGRQVYSDCPLNKPACLPTGQKCLCPQKELHWWNQSNRQTKIVENDNCYLKEELTGYVKNSAWEHERETRLSITLSRNVGEYIDIPLNKEMLENMQIAIGPRSTLKINSLKQTLSNLSEIPTSKIRVSNSYYKEKNLLPELRRHCNINTICPPVFKNSLENKS